MGTCPSYLEPMGCYSDTVKMRVLLKEGPHLSASCTNYEQHSPGEPAEEPGVAHRATSSLPLALNPGVWGSLTVWRHVR